MRGGGRPSTSSPLSRQALGVKAPDMKPLNDGLSPKSRETAAAGLVGHLQVGLKVWVPNPYDEAETKSTYRSGWLPSKVCGRPLWVPATITAVTTPSNRRVSTLKPADLPSIEVTVSTELEPSMTVSLPAPSVHAVNQMSPMEVDDMVDFAHLNEPAVLSGVVTRFLGDAIYTKAGHMLLAVNPYRIILDPAGDSIYDPVYIQRYRDRVSPKILEGLPASKRSKLRLPPHVFEVADGAYTALKSELVPQSVVISGESGAGKTETTKMLLSYLANISTDAAVGPSGRRRARPSLVPPKARRGSIGLANNPFQSDHLSKVERQLLETNPVLEAFGNAKTIRNDNSSRFGKLLRVAFDGKGSIAGWSTSSYLLETSRVVSQAPGERGFHVFYYMLAGADSRTRKELGLLPSSEYVFLNPPARPPPTTGRRGAGAGAGAGAADSSSSSTSGRPTMPLPTIAGVDDAAEWNTLTTKLGLLGFKPTVQSAVWRTVAAILALGNVNFTAEDNDGASVSNPDLVRTIAGNLKVDAEALQTALVTTKVTVMVRTGTTTLKPITVKASQRGRDALAKTLYSRLFRFLIFEINRLVAAAAGVDIESMLRSPEALFIGLLDIFGFEVFETNSLEQLCINYANEKLQAFFTDHVFKLEMETYKAEGIKFGHLTFKDNDGVIDLIETTDKGLFKLLQDACKLPRASDRTLIININSQHARRNKFYRQPDRRTETTHFTIIHSAAPVTYAIDGFIQKNKDRLSTALDEVVRASDDPVIAALLTDAFSVDTSESGGAGAGAGSSSSSSSGGGAAARSFNAPSAFLCSKFKEDMTRLISTLRATQPHFIRCIKPNNLKKPRHVDPALVHHQLMYLGVLDSIRIRHSGFSYRTVYPDFYDRFIIVAQQGGRLVYPPPPGVSIVDLCKELLAQLRDHPIFDGLDYEDNVQFGHTKIFLRKPMIRNLEALREVRLAAMDRMAVKAQALWRGHYVRRQLRDMFEGFLRMQAAWRGRVYRSLWLARTWSARVIQYTVRGWLKRRWYRRYLRAVVSIQMWTRRVEQRREWANLRRGIRVFHSLARGYIVRVHVVQMLNSVTKLQAVGRSFLERNRAYWRRVRAVLVFQAAWRGFKHRVDNEDMMHFLALRRMDRARGRAARRFQATWRALLVWRRYQQIKAAAGVIQRWMLLSLNRQRFLAQQWAVRKIQSVGRGYMGREEVRRVRTLFSIADELWRLQKVRQRELVELAALNDDSKVLQRANTSFYAASKRTPAPQFRVVDVDVRLDNSDVFPRGWTQRFSELEAELWGQGTRPAAVCVGSAHVAVLSEEGRVYTWGWGDRGQCGHGSWVGERRPRLVTSLLQDVHREVDPASVSSGRRGGGGADSDAVSVAGSTATGVGSSSGTGLAASAAARRKRLAKAKMALRSPVSNAMRIKQLACGEEHTVVLSDRGTVYTWGCGRRGQLGHGDTSAQCTPKLVESIHRRVAAIAAGSYHTVLLVAAGTLYTWGSGRQLGTGVFTGTGDQCTPQAVKALKKRRLRSIAAGAGFTMATTNDGDVFSWGSGKDGQLGHGDTRDRLVPTLIEAFHKDSRHGRISGLSCGANHAAAVSSTGRVFTWGQGNYGQLGLGDTESQLTPVWVSSLRLRRAAQVECGARSTHVITDYNEVVGWGLTSSIVGAAAISAAAVDADTDLDAAALGRVSDVDDEAAAGVLGSTDTFFQSYLPLEVPLHNIAGRVPKKLMAAFSHTVSVVGLAYTQLPNAQGRGAAPTRLTKITPRLGAASTTAKPDIHGVLRSRVKTLGTKSAVELDGETDTEVKTSDDTVDSGARLPRLSMSAHKALSQLPRHRIKTLTAEQLRVMSREIEAQESGSTAGADAVAGQAVGTFELDRGDKPASSRPHVPAFGADKAGGGGGGGGGSGSGGRSGGSPSRGGMAPAYAAPTSASVARVSSRAEAKAMPGSPPPPSAGAGAGGIEPAVSPGVKLVGSGDGDGSASGSPTIVVGAPTPGATIPMGHGVKKKRRPTEHKLKLVEAAQRQREEDFHRRHVWRKARERRGRYSAGPDVGGLFAPALLVATSNDDLEVGDVLREYERRRQMPSSAADPLPWMLQQRGVGGGGGGGGGDGVDMSDGSSPARPASKGLTVRGMLSSGMSEVESRTTALPLAETYLLSSRMDGGGGSGSGSGGGSGGILASSAVPSSSFAGNGIAGGGGVGGGASGGSAAATAGTAAASYNRVDGPAVGGANPAEPTSLEDVLNSIKQRAAAQVEALWGSLDAQS